jgi:hypothetical protein
MASRLSSLLVRDGLVGVKRMENAFQRQVIYGGCLDTILLEMKLVAEPRLMQYLSLATGLPPATQEETDVFDAQAMQHCPVDLGRAFRVVPLCFEEGALRVLVHDPVELSLLEDLANELECPVQPLVVPEYRFHMVFARTYGGNPNDRFVALAQREEPPGDTAPVGRSRSVIVEEARAASDPQIVVAAAPASTDAAALERARAEAAEEQEWLEVEERVRLQSEEQARRQDEAQALLEAEEQAMLEAEEQAARPSGQEGQRRAFETANTERVPPADEVATSAATRRAPPRETILGVGLPGGSYDSYHEILQAHFDNQPPVGQTDRFAGVAQTERPPEAGPRATAVLVEQALSGAEPVAHPSIEVSAPEAAATAEPAAAAAPAAAAEKDPGETLSATPLDADSAASLLSEADDRDVIFGLLLRAIRNRASYAGLLTIQGGAAIGRVAIAGQDIDRAAIVEVLIPLDVPSAFKNVVESAAPHIGPIGTGDPDIDQMIRRMGCALSRTALLVPVVLRGRVVAVALGHERDRDIDVVAMGELLQLADLAADAILRALARAKSSRHVAGKDPAAGQAARLPAPPLVVVKSAAGGKHAGAVPNTLPLEPTEPMVTPAAGVVAVAQGSGAVAQGSGAVAQDSGAVAQDSGAVAQDSGAAAVPEYADEQADGDEPEISIEAGEPATMADLLDALESGDAELFMYAKAQLMDRRDEALDPIFERFPGVLAIERYDLGGRLLPAAQHGPLLSFIVELGASTVEHLVAMLASEVRDVRYYATLCMAEIRSQKAVAALVERIFDSDYGARGAAVDALAGYPLELLDQGLKSARDALTDDDPNRVQAAARALADITDIKAIPNLMVAIARGGKYADHARRALMRLTKQDFGTSTRKWRGWWTKNHDKPRIEWLVEGLAHKDDTIRRTSVEELRKLTGEFFDFQFDASKRERENARKQWVAWWQGKGRKRFSI